MTIKIYDESGFIIAETADAKNTKPGNYKINNRRFSDIKPLFSEDYKNANFGYSDNHVVYSGLEHSAKPKLPNITRLPNLLTYNGDVILGSTFGHQHLQKAKGDKRKFQEIYEFLGYGAMLLRNDYVTTLHVLAPNDKVLVETGESMTIINLQQKPLVTLDYANPEMNSASKDFEKENGTFLFGRFNIDDSEKSRLELKFNLKYLPLISGSLKPVVMDGVQLGEDLTNKIASYIQYFEESGINLVLGGNLPKDLRKTFSKPLFELAKQRNRDLLDCLEMD